MGYIPVFLAVLGFVGLWTMVIYNSLKSRRASIDQLVQEKQSSDAETQAISSRLNQEKKHYNNLIDEMPTKLVALVFGFKKVS